jgi:hypothetical protein
MSLKIRRGSESQRLAVTPEDGELLFTTDTKQLYVGWNNTPGGYLISGAGGPGADFQIDYTLGLLTIVGNVINGLNDTFTTSTNFIANTTRVYVNGLRMDRGQDYNEAGNSQIQFIGTAVPATGSNLIIEYIKL